MNQKYKKYIRVPLLFFCFVIPAEGARFAVLKLIAKSHSHKMSLVHLMENGLNMAPIGGMNLSNASAAKLLKYIEENF